MVAALLQPNIFSVLGHAARRRERRGLAIQLSLSLGAGATLLIAAPQWWSLAALLGVSACYALWGLMAGMNAGAAGAWAALPHAIAATGTVLAVAGLLGLAAALFTGDAQGTYTPCGPRATSRYCQGMKEPVRTNRVP